MGKATDAVEALKRAETAVSEIVNFLGISIDGRDNIKVHVSGMRDLEQLPGEVSYAERKSDKYPVAAQKYHNGVQFFYLPSSKERAVLGSLK